MLKKMVPFTLAAVALLAGCSSSPPAGADRPDPVLHSVSGHEYKSIAELEADSTLVVRVTASAAKGREISDVPFTATDVTVREVLNGKADRNRLTVLQMGSPREDSVDTSELLVKGQEYVLFLTDYHLVPGDSTGLHIVTGEQGIYRLDSGTGRYVFASGSESGVPKALRSSDVMALRTAD